MDSPSMVSPRSELQSSDPVQPPNPISQPLAPLQTQPPSSSTQIRPNFYPLEIQNLLQALSQSQFQTPPMQKNQAVQIPPPEFQLQDKPQVSTTPNKRQPEHSMYKNRLQEYCQRSSHELPLYKTVNEGDQHCPRFRSTVWVDGKSYTSQNNFSHRKAAEQDVAKLALEYISQTTKDESGCINQSRERISQDATFCKSILNELAVKMNLQMCTYDTVESEALIPIFISTLKFDCSTYTGEGGKNKKEAEQLAARAAILSLLDDSRFAPALSEIIKSKAKLFATLHRFKNTSYAHPSSVDTGKPEAVSVSPHAQFKAQECLSEPKMPNTETFSSQKTSLAAEYVPQAIEQQPLIRGSSVERPTNCSSSVLELTSHLQQSTTSNTIFRAQESLHMYKMPSSEASSSQQIRLPIEFVPQKSEQPLVLDASSSISKKRRKKNKKKANKRLQNLDGLPVATTSFPEAPPCSLAS